MAHQLSEGSLEVMLSGGHYDSPVMQLLTTKKIQGSGSNERYRLLLSDGKHSYSFAMLATQLNNKIISGELTDNSVVKINDYVASVLNGTSGANERRILIILGITVLIPGNEVGQRLGNPQVWSDAVSATKSTPAPQHVVKSVPVPQKPMTATTPNLDSSLLSTQMTHPITSLSPYQNKWVIKVRVVNKTPVRTWSNAKGEGSLFSMTLCDETGEIRATAFKNECTKFYDMIQVDKVYYISRCQLKAANKQFSNVKNDYEMTFTSETVVAECMDDTSNVPSVNYDFTPINTIGDKNPDSILDVIGVCKMASDVQELTARNTGKQLKKREVTLVDPSGGAVTLTLWGQEAESFDGKSNPVVVVKGARLSEFNGGKSLSCLASTMVRCNPDLPAAHQMRGWYDNGGAHLDTVNVSAKTGSFAGGSDEWLSFAEAESRQLGAGERGDYYALLGCVTYVFTANAVYKACPQEQCNKKLVDLDNGLFRCEKCNREYPNFKYRLMMTLNVSDPTGDQRVTAFNESAEAILGQAAAEVGRLRDYDNTAFQQLFDDIKFKMFVFKMRTKMETYNDEARLKTVVMNAQPLDYKDANKRLINSIKSITGIEI